MDIETRQETSQSTQQELDKVTIKDNPNRKYSISISLGDSRVINSFQCSQSTYNDFLDLSFQVSLDIVDNYEKRGVNFSSFCLDRCPWGNCDIKDMLDAC